MIHGELVRMPVIDGHNDSLGAIWGLGGKEPRSLLERSSDGHIDLPRALEGGLAAGLFAVWIPPDPASMTRRAPAGEPGAEMLPPPVAQSFALRMAVSLTATLIRLEAESAGKIKIVHSYRELHQCLDSKVLGAILHFEGADPIDPQLYALDMFYAAGLRSLGLVWSRPNVFAEGVPLRFPGTPDVGGGLTSYGKDLVKRCNELGILIDVSHLNQRGFWDVASISNSPIVASHSNAHAVTPSARNLTDDQLDAIRDSRGIVGICFATAFARDDGRRNADTPLSVLVRHFDYVANRIGIDHVGFGSDFDGTVVPADIGDVSRLPILLTALSDAGFSKADLEKVAYGNWLRIFEAVWKVS